MKNEKYTLPSDLVLDIKKRLKTLSGQINGILKMFDEGKSPKQINIQFSLLTVEYKKRTNCC